MENAHSRSIGGGVPLHYDIERLSAVLRTLAPKEEKLIRLRYGIGCQRPHSADEMGEFFRVSTWRINRILREARAQLRTFGLEACDLSTAGAFQRELRAEKPLAVLGRSRAVPEVVSAVQSILDSDEDAGEQMLRLRPREFEVFIAEIWSRFGYEVELTAQTRDGGRDVIAVRNAETRLRILIECKRYAPERKVDIVPVRALYGVKTDEKATKAILATTSGFTTDAMRFFDLHRWELEDRDYQGVCEWAKRASRFRKSTDSGIWVPRD